MNYYEILEIKENASQEVIKAAYRALAKKYHPDTYKGSQFEREKNMAQINEAFDVLSDEEKRRRYDLNLKFRRDTETENPNKYSGQNTNNNNYQKQNSYNQQNHNYNSDDKCDENCEDDSEKEYDYPGGGLKDLREGSEKKL